MVHVMGQTLPGEQGLGGPHLSAKPGHRTLGHQPDLLGAGGLH